MRTVTSKDLNRILESEADVLLVNTLAPESFGDTRIPGSVNIPQADDDFVSRVEAKLENKSYPVVVYCSDRSCQASPTAARKLERAGFSNVLHFEGGAKAWTQAGYELAH